MKRIEKIRSIVDQVIETLEHKSNSKSKELTRIDVMMLESCAKLTIALDRHDMEVKDYDIANARAQEDYLKALASVSKESASRLLPSEFVEIEGTPDFDENS